MYFIDLIIILIIFFIKLITDFKRFLNFKYINYKIFKFEEFVNSNKYELLLILNYTNNFY